ncbi:TlyA family RNA methyltransferase [Candidatus Poribacteria bacterium]|nr:TlyA family RNA methyltransferase [Candidatus Poribacteria bacterium]
MARSKPARFRADELLVRRGLADNQDEAARLILSGRVHGQSRLFTKPGERLPENTDLTVKGSAIPYVSRGGLKLAGALDHFGVNPAGRHCLDLGASTGGFTDCLLQRGAATVTAVDVGRGQLHERIARDSRVTVLSRTNIRNLDAAQLRPDLSLIVVDLSFIGLCRVMPDLARLCPGNCSCVALVKPQFELPSRLIPEGGVVLDPAHRKLAVRGVLEGAWRTGFEVLGAVPSTLAGAEGNLEYFVHLVRAASTAPGDSGPPFALDQMLRQAFPDAGPDDAAGNTTEARETT